MYGGQRGWTAAFSGGFASRLGFCQLVSFSCDERLCLANLQVNTNTFKMIPKSKYVSAVAALILYLYPVMVSTDFPVWTSSYVEIQAKNDEIPPPEHYDPDSGHLVLPYQWNSHQELLHSMWIVPFILLCLWFLTSLGQHGEFDVAIASNRR